MLILSVIGNKIFYILVGILGDKYMLNTLLIDLHQIFIATLRCPLVALRSVSFRLLQENIRKNELLIKVDALNKMLIIKYYTL